MLRRASILVAVCLGWAVPGIVWAQFDLPAAAPPSTPAGPGFSNLPEGSSGWPGFTDGSQPGLGHGSVGFPIGNPGALFQPNAPPVPAGEPVAALTDAELFELTETVAQVGDQYILKGELIGDANLILSMPLAQVEKLPPEERARAQQEMQEYRQQLMEKQLLPQAIDRKIKYLEFLRTLPTEPDAKKNDERRRKIQSQAGRAFHEQLGEMLDKLYKVTPEEYTEVARQSPQLYRLALVMKEAGIRSTDDPRLNQLLKAHQTTLDKQRQSYTEHLLGQSAIQHKVNLRPEITHAQMLAYYREHESDYHVPTRAQWEQLTVLFHRFPSEEAAWNEIVSMGDQVYLGGAPFWSVAKKRSQEKNASLGGFHDWTPYGDLTVSRPINEAVFTYDVNRLSPIIKDEVGFHIIRVLQREAAHVQPFLEVQSEIKETLRTETLNKAYADYVAELRQKTPVVTTFEAPSSPASRLAQPPLPPGGVPR